MRARLTNGFTLVEVLIGAMVLVMLFTGIMRIFRSSTGMMKAGLWVNKAQVEVRNTLTYLRDEIAKASPFSKVTSDGVVDDPDEKYKFKFKEGTISKAFSGPILKFYQCKPRIEISNPPKEGTAVYVEVFKSGSKLLMKKVCEIGTPEETMFDNHVLLDDIYEIKISKVPAAANEQMAKAMLQIVITVEDPLWKPPGAPRRVTEESKAKIDALVGTL